MEALYDTIGIGYDGTRRADPGIADTLANLLRLGRDAPYVDVACGTGNYTVALAARGGRWVGIDRSPLMLAGARTKTASVRWCLADATALPLRQGSARGALCTLALHHFTDLRSVFREVRRVVDAGPFVIFTAIPEQMRGYWLNAYFPRALARAIDQMPSLDAVQGALAAAGFRRVGTRPYEVAPDLVDLFMYSGKHRPELYLSPAVRKGISTFASVADPSEVRDGCARLQADIESGAIASVRAAYAHERGDYLFVVAEGE
jgi:SAM-dependent methyltransferase